MTKDEMINRIFDSVREADSATVEQVYWFLMLEMES